MVVLSRFVALLSSLTAINDIAEASPRGTPPSRSMQSCPARISTAPAASIMATPRTPPSSPSRPATVRTVCSLCAFCSPRAFLQSLLRRRLRGDGSHISGQRALAGQHGRWQDGAVGRRGPRGRDVLRARSLHHHFRRVGVCALDSTAPAVPAQGGGEQTKVNPQNKPLTSDFVSLHLKGRTDGFALKGGDATKGAFQTMYDGPRPTHASAPNNCHWHGVNGSYQPMRKQGAIILGTGGDNSNGAVGNFYEVRSALSCAMYGSGCSVLSDSRPSGLHGERGHRGGDRRQDQGEHCRRGLQDRSVSLGGSLARWSLRMKESCAHGFTRSGRFLVFVRASGGNSSCRVGELTGGGRAERGKLRRQAGR